MKIYVGHSKQMDYVNELYQPIMDSNIYKNGKYDFLFPHIPNNDLKNDRDFYSSIDLFFAEISLPATGLGIELGYAHDSNIPIVLLLKKGIKCNTSSKNISKDILIYENKEDLVNKIKKYLNNNF